MPNIKVRNFRSLMRKPFLKALTTLSRTSPLPTTTTSSSTSYTVQFLVKCCGLPLKSARSASQKLQIHENTLQKPQSLLQYLKSHHFNDAHIAKLIEKEPSVLHCRGKNNLKPKFDFLIENGFVGQRLPELIVSNPAILGNALESHIKPSLKLLKSVLDSDEKIVAVLKRSSWLLTFQVKNAVQPNIDFFIKEGIPVNNVAKMILSQPRTITQKHDRMVYVVNALKKLGFQPQTLMFVHALRVMIQMSVSTWNNKIEVMKSLGWKEEEIWWVFKHDPYCLACSEEKFRIGMDFYMNTMNLKLQTVIAYPRLLQFSTDKRIRPRYNVLKVLKSQNLITEERKIVRSLKVSEKNFLENYVIKYADRVPGVLEIYRGTDMAKKIYT